MHQFRDLIVTSWAVALLQVWGLTGIMGLIDAFLIPVAQQRAGVSPHLFATRLVPDNLGIRRGPTFASRSSRPFTAQR